MSRGWWFFAGWLGGSIFVTAGNITLDEWRRARRRARRIDGTSDA